MKTIDLDNLQPDPLAAAIASSDKETLTVSGYICAVDKATISVSETRDGTSYIEYPRSAVIAAFTEGESDQVTLLIDANARVRAISATRVAALRAQAQGTGGAGCGSTYKSGDGYATCCCGSGERCRSLAHTCICEDASRAFFPTDSGFIASLRQTGVPDPGFAAYTSFGMGASPATVVNWQCRTTGGLCPVVCYPIVVNGRVVDSYCYCDCRFPVPDQMKIFNS